MEKQRGIWIDYQKAMIVNPGNGNNVTKIYSDFNIERNHNQKSKMNGQSINLEKKLEAKRKQALREYYGNIIDTLDEESELYIFGPAEAKNELRKEIEGTYKKFNNVTVNTSDSMTDNQIVAKVKVFFNND